MRKYIPQPKHEWHGPNYSGSEPAARELADRIELYWAQRGREVKCDVVEQILDVEPTSNGGKRYQTKVCTIKSNIGGINVRS